MSETSSATKKVIADGFRSVMERKSFEKITIADITDQCGLNRQTFYYHFQDKYDLLNWILYTEVIMPFAEDLNIDNWNEKLLQILSIVRDNSRFYSNAFNAAHGDEFRQYLFNVITELFCDMTDRLVGDEPVNPNDKQFIAEFLSYGVTGSIIKWVRTGMKTSPEATAKYIQIIINNFRQFATSKNFPACPV